jgi:tetratricopeptide (TPR) repeat protein
MPSHIFTRLGLWDESVASNIASWNAAKTHHAVDEQLHAMDYLEYAYLQLGRYDDAHAIVDAAARLNGLENTTKVTYAIAAIPARYALERHDWPAAAALTTPGGIDWSNTPRTAALLEFAIGIGAARSGNIDRARKSETTLAGYVDAVQRDNDTIWLPQLEVQQKTVAAWRMFAEGKKDDALAAMRAAADLEDQSEKLPVTPGALLPARELLGDMLVEAKQTDAAQVEYKAVLALAPNRRNALRASTQR